MRLVLIGFFLLSVILTSCESISSSEEQTKRGGENLNTQINQEKVKYSFMTDSDVEALIKTKDPIFMSSFWMGMSEEESIEIIRYLLDKRLILGSVYNISLQDREPLSRENLKDPELQNNSRDLFCYLTPNTKKIECKLQLIFEDEPNRNYLKRITVSITHDTDLNDFEDFISLFKDKYGAPTRVSTEKPSRDIMPHGDIYRRYSFEKGNKLVDLTYESEHEGIGGGFAPNQIHIMYEDKLIKKELNDKESEQFKLRKQRNDERITKEREESLENI